MSWLDRLTGTTPAQQEAKGDRLRARGRWGEAVLAYRDARDKLARQSTADTVRRDAVASKLQEARNALAREHAQSAADLMDGGFWEDAREMLDLAIAVAADDHLRAGLARRQQSLAANRTPVATAKARDLETAPDAVEDPPRHGTMDEDDFQALCHTLPDPVGGAYRRYGEDFKQGYLALNRGDFKRAVPYLERAHRTHPQPESHIPLELATAYLNLDRRSEARALLSEYRRHHPEALPAYQLLCEIYWEEKEYAQALELLDSLPADLAASLAAAALRGETLVRDGQLEAARELYRRVLARHGWDARTAHRLARVCRDLGADDEALAMYAQLMGPGCGCAPHAAPQIRHEYAELCFAMGRRDAPLLELYIALAQESPGRAAHYYRRVARIYARQGHDREARRYRMLAREREAAAASPSGTPPP